jgi:hypothetical protein
MTKLTGKPRGAMNWLPSQVAYGVDCSDPNPEKWTVFGAAASETTLPSVSPAPGFDLSTSTTRSTKPPAS